MINNILTELEKLLAETEAEIAGIAADPGRSIYEEMRARGRRDGVLDAINAVKIVDIRSILA